MLFRRVKRLYEQAGANRATRGIASLMAGTAAAKLIALAAMPLLTRLYSPTDFGRLSFFTSATAILAPLLTLRYISALPIPRTDRRADQILLLSVITLALSTLALTVIALIFHYVGMSRLIHDRFWESYWWLIVIGASIAAFYEVLTMSATRASRYTVISKSQVTQATTGTLIKIGGGLFAWGGLGLVAGQIVQQGGGIASMLPAFNASFAKARRNFSIAHLRKIALRYSEFPIYRLPSHFVFAYSAQAPVLLSTHLWGSSETGQLGVAFMAIALPISLVSQNAGRVFYAELSKSKSTELALELTASVTRKLLAVGILVACLLAAFAPWAFALAFGPKWALAGDLARALGFTIPFQFVASSIVSAYNVYGGQRRVLVAHTVRALTVTAIILVCAQQKLSLLTTIYIYSAFISAHYSLIWRDVFVTIRKSARVR